MKKLNFSGIQQLGRALMLPIAVLPAAALLLRFGQGDLLDLPFMAAAGAAIFDNLGLLFAIGIAVGFAKENNGAAGLAGVVGYFVTIKGVETLLAVPPELAAGGIEKVAFLAREASRMSIPVGIATGITAGLLYNRFHTIKLPDYLSFFGGRRFVPIVTGVACLGWAVIFGYSWPTLSSGLDGFSSLLSQAGDIGLFFYGVLNRLLIITGLHHIINNVVWFLHGSFSIVQDGMTTVITGDLNRFSRGDPTAGAFMAGFFPIMMFGLPAACLAMYRNALAANRRAVGGVLLSMALTAFLTGITEPIEFAFMFLAPVLYAVHALLTGLSMVIMNVLDVKLGFGFSAGLIDYVINFSRSTHPLYLLPVGAVYFVVYYALFSAAIRFFDLKTMGREAASPEEAGPAPAAAGAALPLAPAAAAGPASGTVSGTASGPASGPASGMSREALRGMIQALGGAANIVSLEACATRLRLTLKNNSATVDQNALRALGAFGFSRPDAASLQVVLGPKADAVALDLKQALGGAVAQASEQDPATAASLGAASGADSRTGTQPADGDDILEAGEKIRGLIRALGGPANLEVVDACATRLRLVVGDNQNIDEAALKRLGAHGIVRPDKKSLQIILGPVADSVASEIQEALQGWRKRTGHGG